MASSFPRGPASTRPSGATMQLPPSFVYSPAAASSSWNSKSGNDSGKQTFHPPGKDTVEFLSLAGNPAEPKSVATIPLMNSLLGPPTNLAVHPNGEIALIANSMEWQKDGQAWKPVPNTTLHVIDLKASPPKVIQTVTTGKQPSGLSISAKGDLALVTNRADNSISVLGIDGNEVKVLDTIAMGDSVAHVAIAPDGRRAVAI